MPTSAPRPCTYLGCGRLVLGGGSRCDAHKQLHTGRFGDRMRGTRQQRGYGAEWDHTRKRILERDCGLCQPCKRGGFITAATQVDHVVNKARGGTDDDENLQSICSPCHSAKTQAEARRGGGG